MEDRVSDEIISLGEKSESQILIEKLIQEEREKYKKEHGKWPEEDGISFYVNL